MRLRLTILVLAVWLLGGPVGAEGPAPRVLTPSDYVAGAYAIDQRYGSIRFSVSHLGLFASEGGFATFTGRVIVDPLSTQRTSVEVDIDAASLDMTWQEAAVMLRSNDYFDVPHFPHIRFHSTSVEIVKSDHYEIHGMLDLRGITRPVTLDAVLVGAVLVGQPNDTAARTVADFMVTGRIDRSQFAMTADRSFISDLVDLRIRARIALTPVGHGR